MAWVSSATIATISSLLADELYEGNGFSLKTTGED